MPEKRRKFDAEFREGAVRLVRETGKPIAQIARDLGVNEGTLGNWVNRHRIVHGQAEQPVSGPDRARLRELERENAELRRVNEVLRAASAYFASEIGPTRRWS